MIQRLWTMSLAVKLGLLCGCLHSHGLDDPGASVGDRKETVATAHPAAEGTSNQQVRVAEAPPEPMVCPAPIERARVEIRQEEPPPPPRSRTKQPGLLPSALATPPPPDPPAVAALRCLLKKHSAEAFAQLQSYDRGRQELLLSLLPLAARVAAADFEHASPQEKAALLEQMMTLVQLLRSQAPLVLEHLCFCQEIQGFAAYHPLQDYVFQPCLHGRFGEHMRVYVEVRNFNSQPCSGGFQTRLTPTLEILDFHKRVVRRMPYPSRSELTRTPRQDYYINIQFNLPPNMPQGRYTLRVQVRDEIQSLNGTAAPRVATGSLDFQVGVKGSVRGSAASSAPDVISVR